MINPLKSIRMKYPHYGLSKSPLWLSYIYQIQKKINISPMISLFEPIEINISLKK